MPGSRCGHHRRVRAWRYSTPVGYVLAKRIGRRWVMPLGGARSTKWGVLAAKSHGIYPHHLQSRSTHIYALLGSMLRAAAGHQITPTTYFISGRQTCAINTTPVQGKRYYSQDFSCFRGQAPIHSRGETHSRCPHHGASTCHFIPCRPTPHRCAFIFSSSPFKGGCDECAREEICIYTR